MKHSSSSPFTHTHTHKHTYIHKHIRIYTHIHIQAHTHTEGKIHFFLMRKNSESGKGTAFRFFVADRRKAWSSYDVPNGFPVWASLCTEFLQQGHTQALRRVVVARCSTEAALASETHPERTLTLIKTLLISRG